MSELEEAMNMIEFWSKPATKTSLCVVRLTTSYWSDKRGLHIKKDIILLKKLSYGFNLLDE